MLKRDDISLLQESFNHKLDEYYQTNPDSISIENIQNIFKDIIDDELKKKYIRKKIYKPVKVPLKPAVNTELNAIITDPVDGRTIDLRGRNLRLHPKRQDYKKWRNLITFNVPEHFRDRYIKAHTYYVNNNNSLTPEQLDHLSKKGVYQTLSEHQLNDYSSWIEEINKDNKIYPDISELKVYNKLNTRKRYELRNTLFGHNLEPDPVFIKKFDQIHPTYYKIRKSALNDATDSVGSDLINNNPIYQKGLTRYKSLTKEQYKNKFSHLVKKYKYTIEDSDEQKHVKLHKFKNEVSKLTPYALDKPYLTWISAFKAKSKYHFPNRYNIIKENDQLHGFHNTAKLKDEFYKSFNQKELSKWEKLVRYETELAKLNTYLPVNELVKSKYYTNKNRENRLKQFNQQ